MKIELVDLHRQYHNYKKEINKAIQLVLDSGNFILGKEVENFEQEFAKFCGVKYCIGVASGTDALYLSLKALGVGPGDEVITVPNSFISTALCISMAGAKPVFVDIKPDTYNIDVKKIGEKITSKTKVIIPVHLYGQPAEMDAIREIANKYNLKILEDACQAHGAFYHNKRVGNLGDIAAFSFYPSKNLGAYGDGGAVVTNNSEFGEKVLLFREYGSKQKHHHLIKGFNSRLDAIQAAILRVKLKYLDEWSKRRRQNALFYDELLSGTSVKIPVISAKVEPVYYFYVIVAPRRDALAAYLAKKGISTTIHYPVPIHLQLAYRELDYKKGDFSVAEKSAKNVLSLPVFPELTKNEIKYIAKNIINFYKKS